MTQMYYKLDENKNIIECSQEEWVGKNDSHCHIEKDILDDKLISTIFLGIDSDYLRVTSEPLVFETVVFDKDAHVLYQNKYSTYKKAKQGHKDAIDWIKNGCKDLMDESL